MQVDARLSPAAQRRLTALGVSARTLKTFSGGDAEEMRKNKEKEKGKRVVKPYKRCLEELQFAVSPVRVGQEKNEEPKEPDAILGIDPHKVLSKLNGGPTPLTLIPDQDEEEAAAAAAEAAGRDQPGYLLRLLLPRAPPPVVQSELNPDYNIEDLFEPIETENLKRKPGKYAAYSVPSLLRSTSLRSSSASYGREEGDSPETDAYDDHSVREFVQARKEQLLNRDRNPLSRRSAGGVVSGASSVWASGLSSQTDSVGSIGSDVFSRLDLEASTTPNYFQVVSTMRASDKKAMLDKIHAKPTTKKVADAKNLPAFISLSSWDSPFPSWATPPRSRTSSKSAASASASAKSAASLGSMGTAYVRSYTSRTESMSLTARPQSSLGSTRRPASTHRPASSHRLASSHHRPASPLSSSTHRPPSTRRPATPSSQPSSPFAAAASASFRSTTSGSTMRLSHLS